MRDPMAAPAACIPTSPHRVSFSGGFAGNEGAVLPPGESFFKKFSLAVSRHNLL